MKVVCDVERFGTDLRRPKRRWGKADCRMPSPGRFELLEPHRRRKEENAKLPQQGTRDLTVMGQKVDPPRPKLQQRGSSAVTMPDSNASGGTLLAKEQQGTLRE